MFKGRRKKAINCSKIRPEFTESITFEKSHDGRVAAQMTENQSRAFVSCVLTPLPTNSFEANNSFTGFMKVKNGQYSLRN